MGLHTNKGLLPRDIEFCGYNVFHKSQSGRPFMRHTNLYALVKGRIIKPGHAYGRDASEVVELLSTALQEKGVLPNQISVSKSDLQGAEKLLPERRAPTDSASTCPK